MHGLHRRPGQKLKGSLGIQTGLGGGRRHRGRTKPLEGVTSQGRESSKNQLLDSWTGLLRHLSVIAQRFSGFTDWPKGR